MISKKKKCFNYLYKPIFVIGVPRSGTTVISEALSVHEETGWFSHYFDKIPYFPVVSILNRTVEIPGIGWYFRGRKKQSPGFTGYLRKILPFSVEAYGVWEKYCGSKFLHDYLRFETASKKQKDRLRNTIKRILFYQGKSRFFSKYTGPSRISYVKSIFPDAYFIHVIRDPRSVVSSLMNIEFWKSGSGLIKPWWNNGMSDEYLKKWENYSLSPIALASIQWNQIIDIAREEATMLNSKHYFEVKYEDFVVFPERTLDNIFQRIELSASENTNRYVKSIAKVKNHKEKYLRYLSVEEINIIENITYNNAIRLGYKFNC